MRFYFPYKFAYRNLGFSVWEHHMLCAYVRIATEHTYTYTVRSVHPSQLRGDWLARARLFSGAICPFFKVHIPSWSLVVTLHHTKKGETSVDPCIRKARYGQGLRIPKFGVEPFFGNVNMPTRGNQKICCKSRLYRVWSNPFFGFLELVIYPITNAQLVITPSSFYIHLSCFHLPPTPSMQRGDL